MKKKISIVGGGACALMLACELNPKKFEITIYEKNAAPGRKFLVAGEGGLNLTHSESEDKFIKRYTPSSFFEEAFRHFSNHDFIDWINALGIKTYIGSSGRVFPMERIKPIEVLNVILVKIKTNKINICTRHTFNDFSPKKLSVDSNDELIKIKSDVIIFCLGGASWPVTGSKGDWTESFKKKDIKINPFKASNCSFNVFWDTSLLQKTEGKALKNISITCDDETHFGEVVITRYGLEGSGIYPLSPQIRSQLEEHDKAEIFIDLKPALTEEKIFDRINAKPEGKNITEHLKARLNLNNTQIDLLKNFVSKEDYLDAAALSKKIKHLKLIVTGTGPMEDAISTVGGIDLDEIDEHFQLRKIPDHFVIGEMLDYDAPTGGYLLQSCFSMAKYLADHLNLTQF